MKKLKSLLILFVILLTVGCGEPKTELDKFKKYLTKSKDFRCIENICKIEKSMGDLIKLTHLYDFDSKIVVNESTGKHDLSNIKIEYNWGTNSSTYISKQFGIETNATYNFETDEYTCFCNDEDKEYAKLECESVKNDLIEIKDNFLKNVKESGTLYFNE